MTEKKVDEVPQLIYDTLKEFGKVTKLIVLADKVGMNTGTLKLYLESDELKDRIHVWTTDNIKWVNIPRGGTIASGTITGIIGIRGGSPSTITTLCEDCKKEFMQSKMGRKSTKCPDCRKNPRRVGEPKVESEAETEELKHIADLVDDEVDEGDESGGEEEVDNDVEEEEAKGEEEIEEEEMEVEVRGIKEVEEDESRLVKLRTDTMVEYVKHRINEIIVDHIMDNETLDIKPLALIKEIRKIPDGLKEKFSSQP